MANHEDREYTDALDVYLALSRTKDGQEARCFRIVAKRPEEDLAMLEARVRLLGGKWRIHKTVNKRDAEKARIWLIHKLIDFPEGRGFVDSLWRTALLQPECIHGAKRFLLDVDTKNPEQLAEFKSKVYGFTTVCEEIETENGWHFITEPFDTRDVCALPYVSLQRDGYVYVKTVKEGV
jgi:hypothetical protein